MRWVAYRVEEEEATMVIIKLISGPKAGQQNLVPMTPDQLFIPAQHGWRWEVDYLGMSELDKFEWFRKDLAAKVVSALIRGAEVTFLDHVWQVPPRNLDEVLVGEIEDTIVYSGFLVTVDHDLEHQLKIGTRGREQ